MPKNLYQPRDVANVAGHLLVGGGLVAATLLIAQPWLAAGIALAASLRLVHVSQKAELLYEKSQKHPESLPESPNLGKIVKELHKASGLPNDACAAYDMRLDPVQTEYDTGSIAEGMKDMSNLMQHACMASVTRLEKTVVRISRPLMKILDDEEEKSVLAHEFAHAAARHNSIHKADIIIGTAVSYIGLGAQIVAMGAAGLKGVAAGVGGYILSHMGLRSLLPNGRLINQTPEKMPFKDALTRLKAKRQRDMMKEVISAAAVTVVSPAYAGVWGIANGISIAAQFTQSSLSRKCEYQADRGAVALGANPLALATSLRKLELVHKRSTELAYQGPLPKPGFISRMWRKAMASHPPTEKRVEKLCAIARQKGYGEQDIAAARHGEISLDPAVVIPPKTLLFMAEMAQN